MKPFEQFRLIGSIKVPLNNILLDWIGSVKLSLNIILLILIQL